MKDFGLVNILLFLISGYFACIVMVYLYEFIEKNYFKKYVIENIVKPLDIFIFWILVGILNIPIYVVIKLILFDLEKIFSNLIK